MRAVSGSEGPSNGGSRLARLTSVLTFFVLVSCVASPEVPSPPTERVMLVLAIGESGMVGAGSLEGLFPSTIPKATP